MTNQPETILTAADLIHSYSRAEAIADGVLVDVTKPASEAGFKVPNHHPRRLGRLCGVERRNRSQKGHNARRKRPPLGCLVDGL